MARKFSRKVRRILSAFLGEDAEGFHVDHIVPYSKGGATDITNAQLIPARVNLRKGAKFMELREWQSEAFMAWRSSSSNTFMLVAVPAGGKTFCALHIAREWMRSGRDRRVLVVVPTANLQEQWRDEACKLGMELQTREFMSSGTFKGGFVGGAVTYSFVGMNSAVMRALVSRAETMVIFDEVHHCGDKATWGDAVKNAFAPASQRLLLSGTPFRTDGTQIPFVEYDDTGFCKADYTFDYKRALKDGVIRYLGFEYSKGAYSGNDGNADVRYEVHSEISEDEASSRLRHLLNADGAFVSDVVRLAHDRLMQLRETIPDAAALAACMDQTHAMKVAEVIRRVTGCEPAVIVSDGEISNATVTEFRDSKREWVVAVRQVAEGTDIKRLQVLCYFANWVTDMFFRQLVGRVQRRRRDDDLEAYVFLPSDPRLIACAKQIDNLQVQAIAEESEEDDEGPTDGPGHRDIDQPGFTFYQSEHSGVELTMIGSYMYSPSDYETIRRMAQAGGTSLETAAAMFQVFSAGSNTVAVAVEDVPQIPLEKRLKPLRTKQHKLAFQYSKLVELDVRAIHNMFKPVAQMEEHELLDKIKTLAAWINEAIRSRPQ